MRRLTPDEFGRLFESFQSSAWRLETLPFYDNARDLAAYAAWQRGEGLPPDDDALAWDAAIRAAHGRGARFERVRLVVEPTGYVLWELNSYRPGEDVRVLEVGPKHPSIGHDAWLFDNQLAVLMEYDQGGRFIAGHATRSVANLRMARAELMAASTPLADYLASLAVRS